MTDLEILYGIENNYKNITPFFETKDYVYIPKNDVVRAKVFGDNHPGILKHIKIKDNAEHSKIYDKNSFVFIKKDNTAKILNNNNETDLQLIWNDIKKDYEINIYFKIELLHSLLLLKHGTFNDEYQEQLLSLAFIKNDNKVLELGGNIGRNSLIISSILNDDKNLVVFESSKTIAKQLAENKQINKLNFHIEESALSKNLLMQKNWETFPYDVNKYKNGGWTLVDSISWDSVCIKYNIKFDTLVLDCEGAIYYILKDEEKLLKDFKTIIIENDFYQIEHKTYVDTVFKNSGFKCILQIPGGWGPCYNFFYEVWSK